MRRQERDRFISLLAEARADDAADLTVRTLTFRSEARRDFVNYKIETDTLLVAQNQEIKHLYQETDYSFQRTSSSRQDFRSDDNSLRAVPDVVNGQSITG